MEQVKSENKIDIFRTIKDLRDYKPTLFSKLVCYILTKLLTKNKHNKLAQLKKINKRLVKG